MSLEIIVTSQCERELKEFPLEVINEFLDAISKLQNGLILSMPLSRSLGSIQRSLYELRFKDRSGIYRVFYFIKKGKSIYELHAFQKKNQKIPKKNLELIKNRLRILK